jgi:hypothetical protein
LNYLKFTGALMQAMCNGSAQAAGLVECDPAPPGATKYEAKVRYDSFRIAEQNGRPRVEFMWLSNGETLTITNMVGWHAMRVSA